MNNSIPADWKLGQLGDLTKVQNGFAFKSSDFSDAGYAAAIRMSNLKHGRIDLSDVKYVSDAAVEGLEQFKLEDGDFLFGMSGSLENYAWYREQDGLCYLNQRVGCLRTKPNADKLFTAYCYLSETVKKAIVNNAAGAAQLNISGTQLESIQVPIPPLPEQQKIATIISSVDNVIENTCAQINKLKNLKAGMMQELLTKGIGHTEFKDSPIGEIPASWSYELLDDISKRGSGHTPNKLKPEYWNGGIDWVSLSDTNKLDQLFISSTKKKISELGIKNSSAVIHPPGTVVLSRDAGIGKSAITTKEMAVSQHFIAWICSDKLNNHYLYYVLQYMKPKFEAIAMGSTIKTIGLSFFKKMKVPVPPLKEQRKISESLKAIDFRIFALEKKKASTELLKKSLMQDLLTGKVRIQIQNQEEERVAV